MIVCYIIMIVCSIHYECNDDPIPNAHSVFASWSKETSVFGRKFNLMLLQMNDNFLLR